MARKGTVGQVNKSVTESPNSLRTVSVTSVRSLPSNHIDIVLPEGRDRDKLIALKKGLKFLSSDITENMEKEIVNKHFDILPRWSSDRNDAWELWDEPEGSKQYMMLKADSLNPEVHIVGFGDIPEIFSARGTSFADAVSKAWLKWFYNTKMLSNVNKTQSMPTPNPDPIPDGQETPMP